MKIKTKLLSLFVMISIVMAIVVTGVFALQTTVFQVGGSITFKATGINATISQGVLTNCSFTDSSVIVGTNKLNKIEINTDKTTSEINSEFKYWQGLGLKFNENLSGTQATLTFSITNNASSGSDEYIFASITTSQGSSKNATVSVTSPSNAKSLYIDPQQTVEYTITFSITDKSANATLSNFAVNFSLERQTEKVALGYTVTVDFSSGTDMDTYHYITINGKDTYTYNDDSTTRQFTDVQTIKFSYRINNSPVTTYLYLSQNGNKVSQQWDSEITIDSDCTFIIVVEYTIIMM